MTRASRIFLSLRAMLCDGPFVVSSWKIELDSAFAFLRGGSLLGGGKCCRILRTVVKGGLGWARLDRLDRVR